MTATSDITQESGHWPFFLAAGRRFIPPQLNGKLSIHLPSGRRIDVGTGSDGLHAELHLRSWMPLWRSIRRSAVGFCEAFIKGEWDSPAPERVFMFYLQNRERLDRAGRAWVRKSQAVRLWHLLRANSKRGAKRNIEAHYDLGNDFYQLWLDPTMSYSSGLFGPGIEDLQSAQEAKYNLVADVIDLEPGQKILEIGCGWGGFARTAAARGAEVLGITLSNEQFAYAQATAAAGARFELMDYREVRGTFDRIASIEMIEAVGEAHWPDYFKTLAERLAPGGIAAIQAITIDEQLFPAYRARADFIQRHIFPGGMLLTPAIIHKHAAAHGLSCSTVRRFGLDYARTLQIWRERFDSATPALAALGFDESFRRKWRLYFCYCEAAFLNGAIDVGVYRLTKTVLNGAGIVADPSRHQAQQDT